MDELLKIVGANGAIVCAKVDAFCGEDNDPCEISHDYFCELLSIDERTLRRLLFKLKMLGYIEYQEGRGKGHCTTYKKGTNLIPFTMTKRGQNCSQKGTKMYPIKYKKNIINAHAPALVKDAAQRVKTAQKTSPIPPITIYANGDMQLSNAIDDAEKRQGRPVAFVEGKTKLHTSHEYVYVYLDDAIEKQLAIVRTYPKQAILNVPKHLIKKIEE